MADTFYPAEYYPIYKAWKTIGGWVVVYLQDSTTMRNVDGGKLHKSRQNAYAKARRLNDSIPDSRNHWYYVDQRDGTCGGYAQATCKVEAIQQSVQSYGLPYRTWRIREMEEEKEPDYR